MTPRSIRKLGVSLGAALAALAITAPVAAAAPTAPTAATAGAVSAPAKLSPAARGLNASPAAALRSYWTADRRKKAISADTLTRTGKAPTGPAAVPTGKSGSVPGAAPAGTTKPTKSRAPHGGATTMGSAATFWPYRGDAPATTVGKVFFTNAANGLDYVCSASVVNSEAKNLVWTAGHCVHGGPGGTWHYNWTVYPHYYYGADPYYGGWSARELWSRTEWTVGGSFSGDFGAAIVYPDGYGQQIANVTGGQGFAWNQARGQYVYDFGYPQAPPFDGQSLQYCDGYTFNSGADLGLNCNMTGGSSGGPWLMYFDGYFGYVNGVNSYKYTNDPSRIYSPYFGNAAGSLYNAVRYRY